MGRSTLGGPAGRSLTFQWTLGEIRDGSGDPWSVRDGSRTLGEIRDGSGALKNVRERVGGPSGDPRGCP